MSVALLKQNAEILLEVVKNYEKMLKDKNNEAALKNFRNQFLYLLTGLHKMIEQEKNVK